MAAKIMVKLCLGAFFWGSVNIDDLELHIL